MITALKKYNGYTLMEMLVVLALFVIISFIGFSSFYGLRDSIAMNENVLSLQQDIRYAQRAALFLDRKPTDSWIYGIGIDFSTVSTDHKYRLFKWCSQFTDYGNVRTKGLIPNYDSSVAVGPLNGNLPVSGAYSTTQCNTGGGTTELVKLEDTGDREVDNSLISILPSSNNTTGDVGDFPAYVVFESVSGKAFFYDSSGNIINYGTTAQIVSSPIPFKIEISSSRTRTKKTINIFNLSGKVSVQKSNL